jgi:hypothetical protein
MSTAACRASASGSGERLVGWGDIILPVPKAHFWYWPEYWPLSIVCGPHFPSAVSNFAQTAARQQAQAPQLRGRCQEGGNVNHRQGRHHATSRGRGHSCRPSVGWHRSVLRAAKGRPVSGLHRGRLSWRDPFAVLLLANSVVAEARPFLDLTIETIELTIEHSIELPTKEAIYANQVWCGTLLGFDELATCVERTQRIEHFSNKARGQVHTAFDRQHQQL